MNPAALVTNLVDLVTGGILIVNKDAFDEKGMAQAGYKPARWTTAVWTATNCFRSR